MECYFWIIVSGWIISKASASNILGNAFISLSQLLHKYNDMDIESIILVTDCDGNHTDCEYVSVAGFLEFISIPTVLMKVDDRIQAKLKNSLEKSSRVLIILYDYETSRRVQEIFSSLPSNYLVNNCWLLIFHTYFDEIAMKNIMTDILGLQQNVQLNSQIYCLTGSKEVLNLLEIYRPCANHPLSLKMLAYFSNGSIAKKNDDFIWDRRSNLELCELKIAYIDWSLLHLISNTTNLLNIARHLQTRGTIYNYNKKQILQAGGKIFYGPEVHMFNLLLSALNFSVTWIHPADNHWGVMDRNAQTWNGIVGALANNEADMSINSLIDTQHRGTVITYSTPLFMVDYKLLMNKPDASITWNSYTAVFDGKYWLALLLVVVLGSMLLLVVLVQDKQEKYTIKKPLPILDSFLSGFASMLLSLGLLDVHLARNLTQDTFTSNRMIFLIICLFGSVNYCIYSAGIISRLMTKTHDIEIHELGDILRNPSYKLIVHEGGSEESYFSESFNTEHQNIWSKTVKENGVVPNYKITREILEKDFHNVAFIPSPYFEMTSDARELHAASQTYAPTTAAYGFSNNSPFIDVFNRQIRRILQSGLNTEMPNLKRSIVDGCCNMENKEYMPFNYDDVFLLFFILGIGLFIALLYCLIEQYIGILESKEV